MCGESQQGLDQGYVHFAPQDTSILCSDLSCFGSTIIYQKLQELINFTSFLKVFLTLKEKNQSDDNFLTLQVTRQCNGLRANATVPMKALK